MRLAREKRGYLGSSSGPLKHDDLRSILPDAPRGNSLFMAGIAILWPARLPPDSGVFQRADERVGGPIPNGRQPVSFLELPVEVAPVINPNARHELLNAHEGGLQQLSRVLKPGRVQMSPWRSPDLGLKDVAES